MTSNWPIKEFFPLNRKSISQLNKEFDQSHRTMEWHPPPIDMFNWNGKQNIEIKIEVFIELRSKLNIEYLTENWIFNYSIQQQIDTVTQKPHWISLIFVLLLLTIIIIYVAFSVVFFSFTYILYIVPIYFWCCSFLAIEFLECLSRRGLIKKWIFPINWHYSIWCEVARNCIFRFVIQI